MMAGMQNGQPAAGTQSESGGQSKRPICGANKSHGGICRSTALYANGRCKMHGGNAARGAAHGNSKGGKSYLSRDMLANAIRDMADPDLRRVDKALALLGRFMEEEASKAGNARKPETRAAHLKTFGDLAVRRSRVLTEEARRTSLSSDSMSRARVGVIMTAFAMVVREAILDSGDNVKDPMGLLLKIQARWRASPTFQSNGVTLPADAGTDDQHTDGARVG